jgi:hypothetical protein
VIAGAARIRMDARPGRQVASAEELVALGRRPLSLAPEPPLILALPQLTESERRDWEWQLNREWTACGCQLGEIGAGFAILAYTGAVLLGLGPDVESTWGHVGWGVLAALGAAALGKVAGRARSGWRFRQLTRDLREVLDAGSSEAPLRPVHRGPDERLRLRSEG